MAGIELVRKQCCCFTGHRHIPKEDRLWVHRLICMAVLKAWREGAVTFLAGGALGFDTLAAQAVLYLQRCFAPDLQLVLVLPCQGQEARWPAWDQRTYRDIRLAASDVIYTGDVYTRSCMFDRNRYLVDHSSRCICWMKPGVKQGGTLYTVNYAKKAGLNVVNLYQPAENTER